VRDACGLTDDEVERLKRVLGSGDVGECLDARSEFESR